MKSLDSELSKKLESIRKKAEERKKTLAQKNAHSDGQGIGRPRKPNTIPLTPHPDQERQTQAQRVEIDLEESARINVAPFVRPADRRAAEVVRPEMNIAKFLDFIFIPTRSKKAREARKKEWHITDADGTKKPASILIEPIKDKKTTTTTSFKYFLAFVQLWEEKRLPEGHVYFSFHEVFRLLGINNPGKEDRKILEEQLDLLNGTRITWIYSFKTPDGKLRNRVRKMHILSDVNYVQLEERDKKERWQALHYIKFHELIIENLKANKTKPVNFQTILDIKSDVAIALYNHLDIVLSGKTSWQRKSVELFKDLHIESKRYELKKLRKVEVKKWIDELNGKELSNGWLQLSLSETKDGSDLKLVAKRKPFNKKRTEYLRNHAEPEYIRELVLELGRVLGSPVENKRLYEVYCSSYKPHLIQQAISEYKADGKDVKNPPAYFSAILHRIAHRNNLNWIKECRQDCKYRSES